MTRGGGRTGREKARGRLRSGFVRASGVRVASAFLCGTRRDRRTSARLPPSPPLPLVNVGDSLSSFLPFSGDPFERTSEASGDRSRAITIRLEQLRARLMNRSRCTREQRQDYRKAVCVSCRRDRRGAMPVTRDELRGRSVSVRAAIAKFPGVV